MMTKSNPPSRAGETVSWLMSSPELSIQTDLSNCNGGKTIQFGPTGRILLSAKLANG
jgi:hypothetical protein